MAIASGRFTAKPGSSMEGVFAALRASVLNTVMPNADKACAAASGLRGVSKRKGSGIGAGWASLSQRSGKEMPPFEPEVSGLGVIFGNLAPAPGGEENKTIFLWSNPE